MVEQPAEESPAPSQPEPASIQAPVSAPVQAPVSTPVQAPVSATVQAPVSAPVQAPVSAPVQAPESVPVQPATVQASESTVQVAPIAQVPPTVQAAPQEPAVTNGHVEPIPVPKEIVQTKQPDSQPEPAPKIDSQTESVVPTVSKDESVAQVETVPVVEPVQAPPQTVPPQNEPPVQSKTVVEEKQPEVVTDVRFEDSNQHLIFGKFSLLTTQYISP